MSDNLPKLTCLYGHESVAPNGYECAVCSTQVMGISESNRCHARKRLMAAVKGEKMNFYIPVSRDVKLSVAADDWPHILDGLPVKTRKALTHYTIQAFCRGERNWV